MTKISQYSVDDWTVIYTDGKMRVQGHSIDDYEWRLMLEESGHEVSDEWVGGLPGLEELDAFGYKFPQTEQELLDYIKEIQE